LKCVTFRSRRRRPLKGAFGSARAASTIIKPLTYKKTALVSYQIVPSSARPRRAPQCRCLAALPPPPPARVPVITQLGFCALKSGVGLPASSAGGTFLPSTFRKLFKLAQASSSVPFYGKFGYDLRGQRILLGVMMVPAPSGLTHGGGRWRGLFAWRGARAGSWPGVRTLPAGSTSPAVSAGRTGRCRISGWRALWPRLAMR
jgi:hypothetical protein